MSNSRPEPNQNKPELFQFLRTLNYLQSLSFDFSVLNSTFNVSHISPLMEATRTAPIRQLFLKIDVESAPSSVVAPGLADLDTLCIRWDAEAESSSNEPRCGFVHLYGLIQSSLATLSRLELYVFSDWQKKKSEFDLTLLRAGGETMRTFHYETDVPASDAKLIKTIAEVFPKLTNISLVEYAIWNVCIKFRNSC